MGHRKATPIRTAQKSLTLLDETINRIHAVMKANPAFDPLLAKEVRECSSRASALLESFRKLQNDEARQVKKLSNEEQREVFVEYYRELSRAYQIELFAIFRRITFGDTEQIAGADVDKQLHEAGQH